MELMIFLRSIVVFIAFFILLSPTSECQCVLLTLGVLIAGVLYSYQISPILSEELKSDTKDRIYISPAGIKCIGCVVGEFVETHCNEPMGKSQCKPCPRGTFSTTPGGDTSCQHCTPCSHGVDETSGCTATSNTGCACPKGTKPNIIDGLIHNCMIDETTASVSTTKEYETTTDDYVSSSQECMSRSTTRIPPSNGCKTCVTETSSVVAAVMLGLIVGSILGVVFLILILRRFTEKRWPSIIATLGRCIGGRWSYNEVPTNSY